VFVSAILHATWNFLAKRAGNSALFTWLFSTAASLLYLPVLVLSAPATGSAVTPLWIIGLAGVCGLHLVYYWLLSRGYRAGDLSIVYPLGRGTGPLLAGIGAILLLGERPTFSVLLGGVVITLGVLLFAGNPFRLHRSDQRSAVLYGLLIGVAIASYTLWDKVAVSALLIPPLVLTWISNTFRAFLLLPHALRHWDEARRTWQRHRLAVISVGVLDSLSYILFLLALQANAVTLLAPLRQISILFGALLGTHLLAEGSGWRRTLAALVVVVGVVIIAVR
jgi:uncharacterized membrane protein